MVNNDVCMCLVKCRRLFTSDIKYRKNDFGVFKLFSRHQRLSNIHLIKVVLNNFFGNLNSVYTIVRHDKFYDLCHLALAGYIKITETD